MHLLILIIFFLFAPHFSLANTDPNNQSFGQSSKWSIKGDNTLAIEYYDVNHNRQSSPYQNLNFHFYDQLNLNFTKQENPFDLFRVQIIGLYNNSKYRYNENGFFLEKINLLKERGDVFLPYRIEGGDIYSFFSIRTLQRSFKGVQLELQPSSNKNNHSLIFLLGTNQQRWENFRNDENYTIGISYLINNDLFGRYSLNFIQNNIVANKITGSLDRIQNIYSIAGDKTFTFLRLEGEYSYFSGDHDGITTPTSGQNKSESAYFFQASNSGNIPLIYRLRLEHYGQDYRPYGASISPDRRSLEGHLGWNFQRGIQIRGRVQSFRDGYETINPTDTTTYGINISGPLLSEKINGNLDIFTSDIQNKNKTTNATTKSINLNLNIPLPDDWRGRLGILYQNNDNKVLNTTDVTTYQFNINGDRSFAFSNLKGSISPGIVYRVTDSQTEDKDIMPTLALNMSKGYHSIAFNSSYNIQNRQTGTDVRTFSNILSYNFLKDINAIRLELSRENRKPENTQQTTSYKMAFLWTLNFEKQSKSMDIPKEPVAVDYREPDLKNITPGADLEEIKNRLANSNIRGGIDFANFTVYETKILKEIDQRQRLVIVHNGKNKVQKSAIIVDYRDIGRPDSLMQTFEEIRKTLIGKYGRPSNFFEKGEIDNNLIENIKNGNFIRIMEWTGINGTIRLGIPRRLDGQVRIEIHYATSFPPVTETMWGIEDVR